MYKKMMVAVILFILPVSLITHYVLGANSNGAEKEEVNSHQSALRYTSAQFTQPEPALKEINQAVSLEGFTKAAESDEMVLYVDEDSLAIKLENKTTGYVWSSGIDNPDNYRLNNTWEQIVQSAITIDYTDRQGKLKTESILTNDSTPEIEFTDNGFTADIFLFQAKLEFQLKVELDGNELVVSIPYESIKEDKYNRLVSMQVYPFLGAAHQDDIQGYMFIPDGSGALIRFEKSKQYSVSPFIGSIYGIDEGVESKIYSDSYVLPAEQVKLPVFGTVHGTEQNGFIGIVEDGDLYGDIVAYPAGATTDFNRVSSQFRYRNDYFQPTSKDKSGIYVYQKDMNPVNVKLRYVFLSNEEADYIGMAKKYQQFLVDSGQLEQQEDKVDVRLEFLGGEKKEGLLWDSVLSMTPISEIPSFVNQLKAQGVDNLSVVYKGWSKGGLTGSLPDKFPFEKSLGNKDDVLNTIVALKHEEVPIYFSTDYTTAFDGASGFSNKDIAKRINSETIAGRVNGVSSYYLSPNQSLQIADDDVPQYQKYGIEYLAIETSGNVLFSDYKDSEVLTREGTKAIYHDLFEKLQKNVGRTALYEPNVYAWKDADKFFDIPMYSSNYMYETDTVPFLQIVLKGYLPYYAPYSNFNSNPEDGLLRMVEYGAYPSFLLTKEPSHLLADTSSSDVYTSEFDIWKEDIINQYASVKNALESVEGATIVDRKILEAGIVEVLYSNGKSIIVNYNNEEYVYNEVHVPEKSYVVVDREG
ncbi:DUF5696 domain-containing protein [Caldibacillus lycopersici]|uniref:DUF5696 domain-containing protein n=1 Tax=Perspicuibacillus lycopersici TaxID=1325689 RepID=A0AAE3IR57_9BACI|nr:DUF5696 domain-containing protein [Perspicuibacillus lycopersici]MCU9612677.1 DUF5696 domain-containing protein [Perspicuibacillus lycopersici]